MKQRPQVEVDPSADTDPRLIETRFVDPTSPRRVDLEELRVAPPPRPQSIPDVGAIIGEVYEVTGELGGGAMGVVLSAVDRVLERRVAIKLIRSTLNAEDFRTRFMLEARAMALVSHPNVVTIHAFGEHHGNPYMVMELVEGQTLDKWLTENGPRPDLDVALRILNQVCLGVSAIHAAGTLHRDLKPSNILLDDQLRARVSDLGLAVQFQDGTLIKELVGTPGYIAPEIQFDVTAEGGATPQSDLYSLACMAFELLTGEPPYNASDDLALAVLHATAGVPLASDIRRDLPRAFDQVLSQSLAKDPKQRMQSVELFRRALMEARNDSLEPVRILVAEDDQDFRELLQLVLAQEFPGADIECVADGRQAIAAFDRKPASVMVLDLQMPEMDGMAVTALLRARPQALQVPIIVLSASGGPKEWQMLSSLGADRFLVKPVNLDDVISTIRRATRERSSRNPAPISTRSCA
ncbi:MAG: response regulator [Myxococcales bacterium]|nr:MAG: response regulator [Myxococcales bacterium]